jgi:hypothetical protein
VKRSLWVLALVSASAFVLAGQGHRAPLMSMHPVGSEIVDRIGPEELQDIRSRVAPDARGAILPNSIDGRAQYIYNVRREVSEPERHDEWDDIIVMQRGFGHLEYGRSIKGGARYGEGEWRGGVLAGDMTTLNLAPGVVIRIPAGVPHVIRPVEGTSLIYLVLKEKVVKLPSTTRTARPPGVRAAVPSADGCCGRRGS